ncbi:MAG: ABC transporter ATP-binding protein [Parachlamydiaceae bacterium]
MNIMGKGTQGANAIFCPLCPLRPLCPLCRFPLNRIPVEKKEGCSYSGNKVGHGHERALGQGHMKEPVLIVNHLTTRLCIEQGFVAVVDDLSFSLHSGKTLAIVGESGCGKSMTALSLLRVLPSPQALPSTGEVIYQGRNLLSLPERTMRTIRGGKIAMIFQDPSSALNPVYTIGNQLMEVAELHLNLYGKEAVDKVLTALKEVGIPAPQERFNDYPHQMSGGMRQRVMIAMALICEPDILIADEPTTALDVTIQAQILDLMRELQQRKGMALLLITHDMGIVAEMADEVIVMYAAQCVERGTASEIFDKMSHPYTQGLFASRLSLHQASTQSTGIQSTRAKLPAIEGSVPSPANFPGGCRFHPRCPYVMEKCRHGAVPAFSIDNTSQGTHSATCWLLDSVLVNCQTQINTLGLRESSRGSQFENGVV